MAEEKELKEIVPQISEPATPQEKVVRLLYKIALLANSSNCNCEVCQIARELSKELTKII